MKIKPEQLNLPDISPVYRLIIESDGCPESPRDTWGNLGTMACWHGNYNLGDEQPKKTPSEYRIQLAEDAESGFEERLERVLDRLTPRARYGTQEWKDAWREVDAEMNKRLDAVLERHYLMLPLYLYDHSGITMSTSAFSCRWDSGEVGFIYVSRKKVLKDYNWKLLTAKRRKQIEGYLRNEVEVYDSYLTGDVHGFTVEVHDNESGEWEHEDSCSGFYGEDAEGVHYHVAHYGFTLEQVKAAFGYNSEPVTTA